MNRNSVLLAEDHELVRAGLRTFVARQGYQIVAEAADGIEAVRLARQHRPDMIVLDLSLPGLHGVEACARIVQQQAGARVLALADEHCGNELYRVLRSGAIGYLHKNAGGEEIGEALRAVMRGDTHVSCCSGLRLTSDYVQRLRTGDAVEPPWPLDALTPRQREILQLIAEGFDAHDIAERLSISQKTVETHRAQLMERLGIFDIPGLTKLAIRCGLVTTLHSLPAAAAR